MWMRNGAGLVCAGFVVAGCMWSPATGTNQESSASVSLSGLTLGQGETVKIKARNWDTDAKVEKASVLSSSSEYDDSGYYAWTAGIPSSSLTRAFWRPEFLGPVEGTGVVPFNGMGRLELSGTQRDTPLTTFTTAQQACVNARLAAGEGPETAGDACSDYTTLVRFDVSAWNQAPIAGNLNVLSENNFVTATTLEGSSAVRVQIVSYASPGVDTVVYGMVCSPPDISQHRLMMYNHGGAFGTSIADAYMCLNVARRGWTMAMTSYRKEPLRVPAEWGLRYGIDAPASAPVVPSHLMSGGRIEVNLGEVMDVLRMLQLLEETHPSVNPGKGFMWGISHGGGITLRAIQSGAKVQAAAALAPAGTWADIVKNCQTRWDACPPPVTPACMPTIDPCRAVVNGGTSDDGITSVLPTATIIGGFPPPPPATGVNRILRSYDWRSPNFFAQDLALRKDVTILIQHGVPDNVVGVGQSCKLASSSFEASLATNVWHRLPGGSLTTASVPACPGISFSAAGAPTNNWGVGQPHLIVYDGIGHETLLAPVMFSDFFNFQHWLETTLGV